MRNVLGSKVQSLEREVRMVNYIRNIFQRPFGEIVDYKNLRAKIYQPLCQMRTDKGSAPSYDDFALQPKLSTWFK